MRDYQDEQQREEDDPHDLTEALLESLGKKGELKAGSQPAQENQQTKVVQEDKVSEESPQLCFKL